MKSILIAALIALTLAGVAQGQTQPPDDPTCTEQGCPVPAPVPPSNPL